MALTWEWLGGFFDGEGTVGASLTGWTGRYPAVWVSLPNTHLDIIEEIHTFVGVGRLQGHDSGNPKHKPTLTWSIVGMVAAIPFLEQIIPHLRMKRRQAELALEFCRMVEARGPSKGMSDEERAARTALVEEIRRLNKKGRD